VSVIGVPLVSAILGATIVVFMFRVIIAGGRFGYRDARTYRIAYGEGCAAPSLIVSGSVGYGLG
jgi:hypothetical protein